MNTAEFAEKWADSTRNERAASQEHFIDLCQMVGVPTPNRALLPEGEEASTRARELETRLPPNGPRTARSMRYRA
jgi:hypothetical protein